MLVDSFLDSNRQGGHPFTLEISLKNEEKVFKRTVYSLLELVGDIGGLYDGLLFITSFFLRYYNASMFEQKLVETLFKFQKTPTKTT